jgi:hypothetical protein
MDANSGGFESSKHSSNMSFDRKKYRRHQNRLWRLDTRTAKAAQIWKPKSLRMSSWQQKRVQVRMDFSSSAEGLTGDSAPQLKQEFL